MPAVNKFKLHGPGNRPRGRNPFEEYVSPQVIGKLLREAGSEIKPPEVKHLQFVVALADDTNPQEVPAMISKVTDALLRHHVHVLQITSSLFVALLGVPFTEGNTPEVRRELVDALLRENGERIRIVHGECDGAFGMFGGQARWTYGAVIPGFSGVLKKLLETKFGTAVEIDGKMPNG
jgi:hypothetical protein